MALTIKVLARRVLEAVQGHDAIVARDGTASVPRMFNPKFSGELEDTARVIQDRIKRLVTAAGNHFDMAFLRTMPNWVDEMKEGNKERNALYALRAIYALGNSPVGFLRTTWQTRTPAADDVIEMLGKEATINAKLGESGCLFQFRRHRTNENNPWVYSWMLAVEGVSISRGSMAPLHKCISGLLKLTPAAVQADAAVQLELAELAKLKGSDEGYYWHLVNQHIATHYIEFSSATSSTSCMAKPRKYYSGMGSRQHPMDCYDNSPDWSMMLISKLPPQDIISMCEATIAAESDDEAEKIFNYPFLTRTMVLPAGKCTNARNVRAPYIFGKTYGHDKIVAFFQNQSPDATALLHQKDSIEGGRISAIRSTREGYTDCYLLPYFDRANKARLVIDEDGSEWWESISSWNDSIRGYQASCSYSSGCAEFVSAWSPAAGRAVTYAGRHLRTFPTLFGPELMQFQEDYQEMTIGENTAFIPKSMLVTIDGETVMRGETIAMYDGTLAIRKETTENTERYIHVEGFGIFDMQNAAHVAAHAMMTGA